MAPSQIQVRTVVNDHDLEVVKRLLFDAGKCFLEKIRLSLGSDEAGNDDRYGGTHKRGPCKDWHLDRDVSVLHQPPLPEEPRCEVDQAHAPVSPDVRVIGSFDIDEVDRLLLQPLLCVTIGCEQRVVCGRRKIQQPQ